MWAGTYVPFQGRFLEILDQTNGFPDRYKISVNDRGRRRKTIRGRTCIYQQRIGLFQGRSRCWSRQIPASNERGSRDSSSSSWGLSQQQRCHIFIILKLLCSFEGWPSYPKRKPVATDTDIVEIATDLLLFAVLWLVASHTPKRSRHSAIFC